MDRLANKNVLISGEDSASGLARMKGEKHT
jgi:hypothetical protein